jgi:hypothetical protein
MNGKHLLGAVRINKNDSLELGMGSMDLREGILGGVY